MSRLAFFVEMTGRSCLLAGADSVMEEIACSLLEAGALVTVWHSDFSPNWQKLVRRFPHQISLIRGELTPGMLDHILQAHDRPQWVILHTGEVGRDAALADLADQAGVLVVRPGQPGRTHLASLVDRSGLQMAVSAEAAPELQKLLRDKLERELSQEWVRGADFFARYRASEAAQKMHPSLQERYFHELAAALVETEGNYSAAELRATRRLKDR